MDSFHRYDVFVPETLPEDGLNIGRMDEDDRQLFITQSTFTQQGDSCSEDELGLHDEQFMRDFNVTTPVSSPDSRYTTIPSSVTPRLEKLNTGVNNIVSAEPGPAHAADVVLSGPAYSTSTGEVNKELDIPYFELDLPLSSVSTSEKKKQVLELSYSSSDDEYLLTALNNAEKQSTPSTPSNKEQMSSNLPDPDEIDFKNNPECPFGCRKSSVASSSGLANIPGNKGKVKDTETSKNISSDSSQTDIKSRFKKVTESEVEKLQMDSKSDRTNKQTRWGVRVFQDWLRFSGHDEKFETLSAPELGTLLKLFYCELRQTDGKTYSKSSLLCIRAAINRHLVGPPYNSNINIMSDSDFKAANSVISGTIKNKKRKGEDVSQKHPPISQQDLKLMYTSGTLSNNSPKSLQYKFFVELCLHFGRQGREGLRYLKKQDIVFKKDEKGREYATLGHNAFEKNHAATHTHEDEHEQIMYSIDSTDCPLATLKLYLSKLNKDSDVFFQRPKLKGYKESPTWYQKAPLGVNTIGNFLPNISAEAKLSRRYTNHCICATTVTLLRDANAYEHADIAKVTGHHNIASIDNYSRTNTNTRVKMSHELSKKLGKVFDVPSVSKNVDSPEKVKLSSVVEKNDDIQPCSPVKPVIPGKVVHDNVAVVKPSPQKAVTPKKRNILSTETVRRSPRLLSKSENIKHSKKVAKE